MHKVTKNYTVVTGASSGIGYETAKAFAARGKHVIVVARRQEKLEELKAELQQKSPHVDVVIRVVDLSATANVHQLYEDLRQYTIETWINNAGFGSYQSVADQDIHKIHKMLKLNVEALTLLSTLYVREYHQMEGAQLINISSAGGYTIVPTAVTYCASKFFVSAFTEGLARELKASGAKLTAKVLAPAATKTEFGQVANNVSQYDYDQCFQSYHTSSQMAGFVLNLYDSDKTVGSVNRETFAFTLCDGVFSYADTTAHNQTVGEIR